MAIPDGHKNNFSTLLRAAAAEDLALMECTKVDTGDLVYVICAVHMDGEEYVFTPLAKLFGGNPYEEILPPTTESPREH